MRSGVKERKRQVDESAYHVDSYKQTVIHQLGFASLRYQYVDYYSRTGDTEWVHQQTEMSVEHTAYLLMISRYIKKAMKYLEISVKLLYKQVTILEHDMVYRNV